MSAPAVDAFARAVAADPRLRALDALVDALCTLVRSGDVMCSGCVWEEIVKPLASDAIGWERGYRPEHADDAPRTLASRMMTFSQLQASVDARKPQPATSETEKWLRTSDAWDAVTDMWIRRLQVADPANGHGIARGRPKDAT